MKGNILVISGPSGSGKSSLMKEVLTQIPDTYFSISSTTRAPREGEVDGVNYHFISKELSFFLINTANVRTIFVITKFIINYSQFIFCSHYHTTLPFLW